MFFKSKRQSILTVETIFLHKKSTCPIITKHIKNRDITKNHARAPLPPPTRITPHHSVPILPQETHYHKSFSHNPDPPCLHQTLLLTESKNQPQLPTRADTYCSVGMMPEGCLARSTGWLPSKTASAIPLHFKLKTKPLMGWLSRHDLLSRTKRSGQIIYIQGLSRGRVRSRERFDAAGSAVDQAYS